MYIITEFRGSWTGGLFWAIPKNWQNMVTGIKFFCVEVITSEASPGLMANMVTGIMLPFKLNSGRWTKRSKRS